MFCGFGVGGGGGRGSFGVPVRALLTS